jgi:hypothetical protein
LNFEAQTPFTLTLWQVSNEFALTSSVNSRSEFNLHVADNAQAEALNSKPIRYGRVVLTCDMLGPFPYSSFNLGGPSGDRSFEVCDAQRSKLRIFIKVWTNAWRGVSIFIWRLSADAQRELEC